MIPDPEVPCFECGETMIPGPRGGMSIDMACPACRREYWVAMWRGMVVFKGWLGLLSAERAALYGLEQ